MPKPKVVEITIRCVVEANSANEAKDLLESLFEEMPDWLVSAEPVGKSKRRTATNDEMESMCWSDEDEEGGS